MSLRLRGAAWALLGAGSMVLSACGTEGDDSRTPLEPVQATSYVTIEPATTTTTIAAADTTLPPEGAIDPNEQVYVIQGGDSVSRIASLHGITMEQLVQYNQWTDGINHVLIPGVEVRIPPNSKVPGTGSASGATTGTTPSASGTTPTESASEGCTHTIEAGENPSRVAEDYGITFDILQQANPNRDFRTWFMVGETINIPAGADC